MNELSDQSPHASSSRERSTNSGKDPPPLSTTQAQILKATEETLIRMLAEKKVDTNVYGGAGSQNGDAQRPLRENEQNVKNRAREARFNAHIQRCAPLPLPLPPTAGFCAVLVDAEYIAGQSRKRRRGRSCRTRTTCTESQYKRTWRRGGVL